MSATTVCIYNGEIYNQKVVVHFLETDWGQVEAAIDRFVSGSPIYLGKDKVGADTCYLFSLESGRRIWLCADHAPYKPGPCMGEVTASGMDEEMFALFKKELVAQLVNTFLQSRSA